MRELLSADACIWEGSMKDDAGRPMIFCGTKGMAYVELRAKGASHDLHSMYGGLAPNPAWRLVQALRTIKDESGVDHAGWAERADRTSLGERSGGHQRGSRSTNPASNLPGDVETFDRNLTGEEALKEMLLRPDGQHRRHRIRLHRTRRQNHRPLGSVREDGLSARRGPEPRSRG